jgi:hypothetical protein
LHLDFKGYCMGKKTPASWDNKIYFGVGRSKGEHHTGFHTIQMDDGNGATISQGVFSGFVWRGDSRSPDKVFNKGFQVDASGETKSGRATSLMPGISPMGYTRGVISTTELMYLAADFAAFNSERAREEYGWVYLIGVQNDPGVASAYVNAGNHLLAASAANKQMEFMFRKVETSDVMCARRVKYALDELGCKTIVLVGDVINNGSYKGPELSQATVDKDFSLKRFLEPGDNLTPMPTTAAEKQAFAEQLDRVSSSEIPLKQRAKKYPQPDPNTKQRFFKSKIKKKRDEQLSESDERDVDQNP